MPLDPPTPVAPARSGPSSSPTTGRTGEGLGVRASAVSARGVAKSYMFHEQLPGLGGALRSLVRRQQLTRIAVDALDLEIAPGEIVGLLGRNGAGKTTMIKMLSGLLRPTAGDVTVLGFRPAQRQFEFLRRIAVVLGQKSMLWWDVPAMDSFLVHKAMYALTSADFDASVHELSQLLDIGRLLHVPVRKLSLGERMRCELMLALLHRPDLLFLDEPTIGLDVVAKATIREFLAAVNEARGTTVLLTSHDMDDVEALCPRVVLIDRGRLQFDGALTYLARRTRPHKRVRVTYAERIRLTASLPPDTALVADRDGREFAFEVAHSRLPQLLAALPTWGALVDLDVAEADLDEIMRAVFSDGAAS